MRDVLQYRCFEDLRRAWRVAQPNLEQVGLLRIEYAGLEWVAQDGQAWLSVPGFGEVEPAKREDVLRVFLDHLRFNLVIQSEHLSEYRILEVATRSRSWLREPWCIGEDERLHSGRVATLPHVKTSIKDPLGLGYLSALGKYLRKGETWGRGEDYSADQAEEMVRCVAAILRGHILSAVEEKGTPVGIRLMDGAIVWRAGDGRRPPPDPVRFRHAAFQLEDTVNRKANVYFSELYGERSRDLKHLFGREHTAQVAAGRREEREREFREGRCRRSFARPRWSWASTLRTCTSSTCGMCLAVRPATRSAAAGRGAGAGLPWW